MSGKEFSRFVSLPIHSAQGAYRFLLFCVFAAFDGMFAVNALDGVLS